jgi:hypothetical protein
MVVSWRNGEKRAIARGWKLLQELSAGEQKRIFGKARADC